MNNCHRAPLKIALYILLRIFVKTPFLIKIKYYLKIKNIRNFKLILKHKRKIYEYEVFIVIIIYNFELWINIKVLKKDDMYNFYFNF